MTKETHVVIVGGGATGSIILLGMMRHNIVAGASRFRVTIIDPNATLGLGKAYSTHELEHILNVSVDKMSANPDDTNEFLHWVEANKDPDHTFRYWPFLPRAWFGAYISEKVQGIGVDQFIHIRQQVTQIKKSWKKWIIQTADKKNIYADFLVVASGYKKAILPPFRTSEPVRLIQCDDTQRIGQIGSNDRVLIVGTGLTAVDCLRQLRRNVKSPITFLSRHGMFPLGNVSYSSHHAHQAPHVKMPPLTGMSPLQIFRVIRALKSSGPCDWGCLANGVRPQLSRIWRYWTIKEKRRFLQHLKSYWEVIRHRLPPEVAEEISRERNQGQIQVLKGSIKNIEYKKDAAGAIVQFQPRGEVSQASLKEIQWDWIILATGYAIDQSLAQPYSILEIGSGFESCQFGFGYRNINAPHLWVAGPAAKTEYWEITAIPEILVQAKTIVQEVTEMSYRGLRMNVLSGIRYHPQQAGESYGKHFLEAISISLFLFKSALICTTHAILPFIFTDRTSKNLRDFTLKISKRIAAKGISDKKIEKEK